MDPSTPPSQGNVRRQLPASYYAAVDELASVRMAALVAGKVAQVANPERYATPELLAAQARYEAACRQAGVVPTVPDWD